MGKTSSKRNVHQMLNMAKHNIRNKYGLLNKKVVDSRKRIELKRVSA